MRVLIISQYFWPENFRVNELSEELNKLGHKVTILTGYPNYPSGEIFEEFKKNKSKFYEYKGAEIIRVALLPRKNNKLNLVLNYISFLVSSIIFGYFKMLGRNFDIIFTFQLSPVTVGITSSFFSFIKNCPNIFWVLDLWPDTLVALKVLKSEWQIKLFKILINWIYSNCDIVLAQSKSILKEIKNYKSIKNNAYYFPSWGESDLFFKNKKPAPEVKPKKIFTILFAGNIGEAQDFPNIIKAVKLLSLQNINDFRILIVGSGSKKDWVIREVKKLKIDKHFEFYKNYPLERMSSFFLHADALLVSLSNNRVFNMTIPGKVQFYLSSGIPIIGMICGEASQVIKDSKAGYVCESGDYISLSKIISKISKQDKKRLKAMGRNGREYAKKEFSKISLIKKLNKIINKLSTKNQL